MTDHSTNPWICAECGKEHTVPSLARACESRHQRERFAPATPALGEWSLVDHPAAPGA